jgi:hypothetical protein
LARLTRAPRKLGPQINFVPTHHWMPPPGGHGVAAGVGNYCAMDGNNGDIQCVPWNDEYTAFFKSSMQVCLAEALRMGKTINIRPHLVGWRAEQSGQRERGGSGAGRGLGWRAAGRTQPLERGWAPAAVHRRSARLGPGQPRLARQAQRHLNSQARRPRRHRRRSRSPPAAPRPPNRRPPRKNRAPAPGPQDDASPEKNWRNGLTFNPRQPYGGYTYFDIMLRPLAEALRDAIYQVQREGSLYAKPKVYFSLQVRGRDGGAEAER